MHTIRETSNPRMLIQAGKCHCLMSFLVLFVMLIMQRLS